LLRLYSDTTFLGLRRDLSVAFKAAEAKIPLKARPLDRRDDLSFIQAFYGDIFPRLHEDEALLEGAYTAEDFRGQGVMASAMAQIAERANDLGARWVITFVGERHIASLKGCKRAGFVPYVRRREIYRLFRHKVTFTPLPEGAPYPFDLENKHPHPPNADKTA